MRRSIVTSRCTLEGIPCAKHSLCKHFRISASLHLRSQRTPWQAQTPTVRVQVHKMASTGGLQGSGGCSEHRGMDRVPVDKRAQVEVDLDTRAMVATGLRRTMTGMTLIQDSTISTASCRHTRRPGWREQVDHRMDRLPGTTANGERWTRKGSPRSRILRSITKCMAAMPRCQSRPSSRKGRCVDMKVVSKCQNE